jgi:hypothetical protein
MTTKAEALPLIRDASERLLADCAGASDVQWVFRPTPTQWSMAQITEHVAMANISLIPLALSSLGSFCTPGSAAFFAAGFP